MGNFGRQLSNAKFLSDIYFTRLLMLKGRASGGKPEIVVVKDDIIVFQ